MVVRPYTELAPYYDLTYLWKDYAKEAAILHRLARRLGPGDARRLADIGCGTGEHLVHFRRWYAVEGVDRSASMLDRARKKLPGVPLHRAPMTRFRLREPADVLTCLFSAIGYLPDDRSVLRAFRAFYRALRPGGVALVEPWISPADWKPGRPHLLEYRGRDLMIARMNVSQRHGDVSIMEFHFLIGDRQRVRHVVERHTQRLVAPQHLTGLMRQAGFDARFDRRSMPLGRGLLIGIRPGRERRP